MTSQPGKQNYTAHIAQYLEKQIQLDNEICSVNRM